MLPTKLASEQKPPADRPGRFTSGERIRQFWQRVTEGLELEDLWAQFASEARASYGLYSREVDWAAIERAPRWKRPFRTAGELF